MSLHKPLTPEEEKLVQDFWCLKKRDANGKRLRPCDFTVTLTAEEQAALVLQYPTTRSTQFQLIKASRGNPT